MHFDMAKIEFRFSIFGLYHKLLRGSGVTMGSEDTLKIVLKGKIVQKGSSWTCFNHGQFEIKTFPYLRPPRPNVQNFHLLIKSL